MNNKRLSKIEEEYEALVETENRIYRKLMELNVLDVAVYESTRRVIEYGQRRMRITDLYAKVRDALVSINRELDVKYQLAENKKLERLEYILLVLTAVQAVEASLNIPKVVSLQLELIMVIFLTAVSVFIYIIITRMRP
ncbi:hypothetical protein [Vulcanisaeta souniana]|uniref:hypothetical protein n=1 Tax=Vulcanisaeta souniana TaxID=164452 RepID=UPI0006CF25E3|nr:hypothetical protein [Vulcanisaeta souniana]